METTENKTPFAHDGKQAMIAYIKPYED